MIACDPRTGAVRTAVFDGPLELLLFLVQRDGVDLRDVPIAPITDAFLVQLDAMVSLDLDVASDFLVMASTLCWLKSKELLPKHDAATDEQDELFAAKADLQRRLMDYRRYREAAEALGNRPMMGRETFTRPASAQPGVARPIEPGIDALGLLELFYGVLQRQTEPAAAHAVTREPVSIEQMADWLLERLDHGPRELGQLLHMLPHSEERIVGFLATLEMARLGMVDIEQGEHLGPITVQGTADGAAVRESGDLSVLTGGFEARASGAASGTAS